MPIVEKTLRWLVIVSIFALTIIPFIISSSLFFPFITGKNFTFRILVEIMAAGWLSLALIYPAYRPRRSWITIAFAIFVVVIALADALGAYPFKSFWSNYERMDGWVTLAHLFVLFIVASSTFNTEKLWRAFWKFALVISVAIASYGFLQLFGLASLTTGFSSLERLDATFGNPIYLAVYMLFHVFIAALLWAQAWATSRPGERQGFSFVYGAVMVIDCIVLFLTATRGTIMGLIGGGLIALFLYTFLNPLPEVRRMRVYALGAVAAIILLGGSLWLARDASFVKSIGFLNRLASISLTDSTTKARFYNWGMAWQGVKERPILGWGQENYALVFDKYYDPRMYSAEQWFDRVHNIVFDWLVAGGFVGLLSYLSIFAAALFALWRGNTFRVIERSILTGLLAAYFIHDFFVFDNVTSYIMFGLVIAYIAWRSASSPSGGSGKSASKKVASLWEAALPAKSLPIVAVVLGFALWGAASWINASALTQNRLLIQAISPQEGGVAKNLEYFKSSIAQGALGTQEAREQLMQAATQVASSAEVDQKTKQAFYDTAVAELKAQQIASPLDARPAVFLGLLYGAFGNYPAAAEALEHAHSLSPNKQSILYEMAQNAQSRGDAAGMMRFLDTAYRLDTDNLQARTIYAAAAIRMGNNTLADELLAPIIPTGEAAEAHVTQAYYAAKRFDKIAVIWSAYVQVHPEDVQGYYTLAAAYYGMDDRTKAIEALQAASKLSPDIAAQVAIFIDQIRKGTLKLE